VSDTRQIRNLALVGFMGTGKSSVGRQVAGDLNFQFVDTDQLIEERAGSKITDIFDREGEAVFRRLEGQLVREMEGWDRTVISTGGGLVINPDNLTSLKRHALVVCLWASPEAIWNRIKNQTHRPLLMAADPMERIRELLTAREPAYRQADVLLSSEFRPVRDVAGQVLHHFRSVNGARESG
jgi:shikimate kinase